MFEITLEKKELTIPLQMVAGAVDKKQLLPILSTILMRCSEKTLLLTATDLEIEITAQMPSDQQAASGEITIPAKKFIDIIRTLEDDAKLRIRVKDTGLFIESGKSQFKLMTLPVKDFPLTRDEGWETTLSLPRETLVHLLQSTAFAISQQDVRVFLNGMLFELDGKQITTVAADGHRMAICRSSHEQAMSLTRLILPRKSVFELLRLMNVVEETSVQVFLGKGLFKVQTAAYSFTSKLLESRFLPYHQVIPKQLNTFVLVDRDALKRSLTRILIVANEKTRPVIVEIESGRFTLIANNQEQEEAIESIEATVDGEGMRIGLNPIYLLDVLQIFQEGLVRLSFYNADTSILVESLHDDAYQYIIMPMKL